MFRLLSGNWQGGLCNSLHQLQQNGLLCDLVLNLADDKQVHAHSCVMAAASPYLRELIVANNANSHLETLNSEAVQVLISYMYSGELEFTKLLLPDLLKAAQMLQMDPLIEELARYHHCFLQSRHQIVSRDGCVRQPDIGSCLYLPTELTPVKRPSFADDYDDNVSTSSSSDDDEENDANEDYNGGGDNSLSSSFTNSLPDLCLPCEACGKTFKQKGALGMHYKSHIIEATNSKGEIEMISCKACLASLKKGIHFLVHLKNCPKREKFRLETTRVKEQPFHCPLCNNNFEQKGAFGSHMKTHCVETYDKDNVRVSMRCKMCQSVFSERSDFMDHAETCPGRRSKQPPASPQHQQIRMRCKYADCPHVFQSRSSMIKHYIIHHGSVKSCIFKSSQTIAAKKSTSVVANKTPVNSPQKPAGSGFNVSYRCTRCRKSFNNQADWMRHKMTKHSFFCAKCGKKFTSKSSFQAHIENACLLIEKASSSNCNQPVKCKLCNREFSGMYNLQKHMPFCKYKPVAGPNSPVRCEMCKRQLSCDKALINHREFCKVIRRQKLREQRMANNGASDTDSSTVSKVDSDADKTKKVMVNGTSSKMLSPPPPPPPPPPPVKPKEPEIKEDKEKKEEKKEDKKEQQRFICGLCGIVVTDEAKYQQHKKICSDTYNCEACGAKFKTQAKYIEHKDKHTECVSIDDMYVEEIHSCGACFEKFNTPLKVTMHANKVHKGAENQKAMAMYRRDLRQCQVCKAKINKHQEPYYHHMWMKHGVKSYFHSAYYKCDLCHKRYIDPREFEMHEASHEENNKRHACTLCELKFRRKQLLERHMSEKHATGKLKQD